MAEKCGQPAVIRRFWPGEEPDLICIDHATDSKKVAEAIGVYVHMQPADLNPPPKEWPTCACSKGFSQTVIVDGPKES